MKLQLIPVLLFVASVCCDGPTGGQQSPIDLTTIRARPAFEITPLQFMVYQEDPTQVTVQYDGYTVVYRFEYANGQNVTARGGPLRETYQMDSIHFHWGPNSSVGSEHFVDGFQYAMEMHIVCFNQQYGSIEEAETQSDGLFMLGIFFSPGTRGKQEATAEPDYGWIPAIEEIQEAGTIYTLPDPAVFNIGRLIGTGRTPYFTYRGSMTTPPYYESVIWAVQENPLPISERQLNTFRSRAQFIGGPLNFREVMSLDFGTLLSRVMSPQISQAPWTFFSQG